MTYLSTAAHQGESAFDRQIEAMGRRLETMQQRAGGLSEQQPLPGEALEELVNTLEELQVASEELRQQTEERAAAHQAVEAERQRYQELFDFAPDGYLVTDRQGIIREANRAAAALLNIRQDYLVGKPLAVFVAGEDRQAFRSQLSQLRDLTGLEIRLQPYAGAAPFPAALTVGVARDGVGQLIGLRWLVRDITQRKRAEEEKEKLQSQLVQAQKMEAVGRLTAGIAHDFNNLLTAINGFAELMRLELSPDDPLQEMLGKILGSGRRAADLVRQLLAFARKQIIEPQVLDLNAVVSDMDRMLQRIIGENIELKTGLAPGLWAVKADPAQLEQVIVNLAVNARDAMLDGGALTIETSSVVLDEDYAASHLETQPGEYVLLTFSDTGLGMTEEVKAHLFEPFFTTKGVGQGTGLGLATVFGIVKQSGGHTWVYSEEGHGTTFKIYLPRVEAAVTPVYRRDRAGDLSRGMETVLLVEDDQAIRELTARVLRQQGYTMLEAANGQEALRLAREHGGEIQLLLTDVIMPGMSGKALAGQLAKIQPGLKVLFVSGYTDDAIAHHGVLEPGIPFLQKPFNPMDLARKVRAVLDSH